MAIDLERMYDIGGKLAGLKEQKEFAENVAEYLEILEGVKGTDQTKKLASQFISRFFLQFPEQSDQSIDAMLDLCEDINVDIRKQAIKDLPNLCRDNNKTNLAKIVDVLTQLLSSEDTSEIQIIQNSLMNLFRRDTQGAIMGVFSQIHNGDDAVRERALRFLHTKLKTGSIDINKEAQAQIVAEVKKAFEAESGLTADDFQRLMGLLTFTHLPKTVAGQIEIVNMIMSMAELDKTADFNYASAELTDRLLQCAQQCIPYFSAAVKSTPFCEYICTKVLPHYHQLQDLPNADAKAQLIKALAELTINIGQLEDPGTCSKNVFERLIDYMPLPPPVDEEGSPSAAAATDTPPIEFTKVECLMFTFHAIGKQSDAFLKEDEERLKDFRTRLQYLARGVSGYLKKLREFLNSPAGKKADSDDVKIKKIALRSTENLQAMIKDLFHNPPIYKANIRLSWREDDPKAAQKRRMISGPTASSGVAASKKPTKSLYMDNVGGKGGGGSDIKKKPTVSNYVPPSKKVARPAGLYQPPTGQYSGKIKTPIVWND